MVAGFETVSTGESTEEEPEDLEYLVAKNQRLQQEMHAREVIEGQVDEE